MMKKTISVLLAFVMMLALMPVGVFAADTTTSGTTGGCTWALDGTVLTISPAGDGVMADYAQYTTTALPTPWGTSITQVIFEDGVTTIGAMAFANCVYLNSISLPDSLTTIRLRAFIGCTALTSVSMPVSVTEVRSQAFVSCDSLETVFYEGTWDDFLKLNWDDDNAELIENLFMVNMEPVVVAISGEKGIDLEWTDNPGADGFRIYRRDRKQGVWGGWAQIATVKKTVTYTDKTVTNGGEYMYTVRAYKGDMLTPFISTDPCFYLLPTMVEQTNDADGVRLSWNKNTAAEGYAIYRYVWSDIKNNWVDESLIARTGKTDYVDKNVNHGQYYSYYVHAYIGNSYGFADYADLYGYIRRLNAPKVTAANDSEGITITWERVNHARRYEVYRRTYENSAWSKWRSLGNHFKTSYSDSTAEAGKAYQYAVRAVSVTSEDSFSSADGVASVRRLTAPKVEVSNVTKGIKLSWGKVAGASKYYIYRRTGSGKWSRIKTTSTTSYTDAGAKAGKNYTYRVRAVRGDSVSSYKTTSSIRRLKATSSVKMAKAKKGFKLTWSKVTGAKQYEVYRQVGSGSWKKIKTLTKTTYTDKSAQKGKYYTYRVRATYGSSKGAYKTSKKTKR